MSAVAMRRAGRIHPTMGPQPDRWEMKMAGPKRPEYEPRGFDQCLAYLVEELGECLAAAGKTQRWGPESYNPELPPHARETNIDWLFREIEDAEAAILRLRRECRR